MKLFGRKKAEPAAFVQTGRAVNYPFSDLMGYAPLGGHEARLYEALREAVPIIDAALLKLVRLVGGFEVEAEDEAAQGELEDFLLNVKVGPLGKGIHAFISCYLDQLLTYGTAVGEIVPTARRDNIAALYNVRLDDIELKRGDNPLEVTVCARDEGGKPVPVKYPDLVLMTALNPEPGKATGVSLLRGLPFVSGVLLKIYNTIGLNWERVGNLRFAVTYNPGNDPLDKAYARERAMSIAREWSEAMQAGASGQVKDFVAVGDVSIKVIGADSQVLDSSVPVRQMLEQIVAKLGLPPFILGVNWSTTERMSSQQSDILTSELEAYRRLLTPVIDKICNTWLRMRGFRPGVRVEWDVINLQDDVEGAKARLLAAQAFEIENRLIHGNS